MKWFWRILKWGAIGVVILVVGGMILGNLVVNSGVFKKKLGAALEANLGLVVGFESVSYWPWSGLSIRGLSADMPGRDQEKGERALANVGEIRVEPDLFSLFSDDIIVKRVVVSEPLLDGLRVADGSLLLPFPRSQVRAMRVERPIAVNPPPKQEPTKVTDPPSTAVASPPLPEKEVVESPPKKVATPAPAPVVTKPQQPKLRHGVFLHQVGKRVGLAELELDGGGIRLLAEGVKSPLFEIADYGLQIDLSGTEESLGEAELGAVKVMGVEMGKQFSSPVAMRRGGDLYFSEIEGALLSGQGRGKLRISATQAGLPFSLQFSGEELSVERFGKGLKGLQLPVVPDAGTVNFGLVAKGYAEVPESVEAAFEVRARDLDASDLRALIPAVRAIGGGRAFVMSDLFLTDVDAQIQLKQGVIVMPHFRARTKHFIVRCHGASAQGKLDVRARIYATKEGTKFFKEIGKRVGGVLDPGFVELEGTSWFYREIQIGGTVEDPMGDFLQPGKVIRLREAFDIVRDAAGKKMKK